VDDVVTAGLQSGREAAGEAGGQACKEREGQQAQAEAGAERVGGEVLGQEGDEGAHGRRRESDPKHTAGDGEQEAICQKLAADAGAGGAQGKAGA
jgi:hypothetical protein